MGRRSANLGAERIDPHPLRTGAPNLACTALAESADRHIAREDGTEVDWAVCGS